MDLILNIILKISLAQAAKDDDAISYDDKLCPVLVNIHPPILVGKVLIIWFPHPFHSWSMWINPDVNTMSIKKSTEFEIDDEITEFRIWNIANKGNYRCVI